MVGFVAGGASTDALTSIGLEVQVAVVGGWVVVVGGGWVVVGGGWVVVGGGSVGDDGGSVGRGRRIGWRRLGIGGRSIRASRSRGEGRRGGRSVWWARRRSGRRGCDAGRAKSGSRARGRCGAHDLDLRLRRRLTAAIGPRHRDAYSDECDRADHEQEDHHPASPVHARAGMPLAAAERLGRGFAAHREDGGEDRALDRRPRRRRRYAVDPCEQVVLGVGRRFTRGRGLHPAVAEPRVAEICKFVVRVFTHRYQFHRETLGTRTPANRPVSTPPSPTELSTSDRAGTIPPLHCRAADRRSSGARYESRQVGVPV